MSHSVKNYLIFFAVLWCHITILDLFYVTPSDVKFLWKENVEPLTIFIHAVTALIATLCLALICQFRVLKARGTITLGNKFWAACSLLLVALIGVLFI